MTDKITKPHRWHVLLLLWVMIWMNDSVRANSYILLADDTMAHVSEENDSIPAVSKSQDLSRQLLVCLNDDDSIDVNANESDGKHIRISLGNDQDQFAILYNIKPLDIDYIQMRRDRKILNQHVTYGKNVLTIKTKRKVSLRKRNILKKRLNDAFIDMELPHFVGGAEALLDFMAKNFRYPSIECLCQGRVIVEFTVNTDGTISNPKVIWSLDTAIDKECVRVVNSMPKWIPGKYRGVHVPMRISVPFTIRLT